MAEYWTSIKSYMKSPYFTPKIDRYLGAVSGLVGAFAGAFMSHFISIWEGILYLAAIFIVVDPAVKFTGKKWREKKGLHQKDLKPSVKAERIVSNIAIGFSILFLLLNITAIVLVDALPWPSIGISIFLILWCFLWRYINIKRIKKKLASSQD